MDIIIGHYLDSDVHLFFGGDPVIHYEKMDSFPVLLRTLGVFKSSSEAARNGWKKPIPLGFSQHSIRISKEKQTLTILNNPLWWDTLFIRS